MSKEAQTLADYTAECCSNYPDVCAERDKYKELAEECLRALKLWERARKDGGVSHADLYQAAWEATKAAIKLSEEPETRGALTLDGKRDAMTPLFEAEEQRATQFLRGQFTQTQERGTTRFAAEASDLLLPVGHFPKTFRIIGIDGDFIHTTTGRDGAHYYDHAFDGYQATIFND